jgi:WD40 repeat protein
VAASAVSRRSGRLAFAVLSLAAAGATWAGAKDAGAPAAIAPAAAHSADAGAPNAIVRPPPGPSSVSADADGTLWLRGHREPIYSVAMSADGGLGATGSGDRTVRLWNVSARASGPVVPGADEAITALAFSPKGDLLAAGDRAFQVRLIRVSDGTVLKLQAHPDAVSTVDFSPDGRWVLVAGFGGNAAVYPVEGSTKAKCDLRGRTGQFTDAGRHLVLASQTGGLSLYDFPACKLLKQTPTAPHAPFAFASGRATLVATRNGRENVVRLWDAVSATPLGRIEGHTLGVTTAQLTFDGKRLLTASEDGTVRLWDVEKRSELGRVAAPGVPFAALGPDGVTALVVSGIEARVVRLLR